MATRKKSISQEINQNALSINSNVLCGFNRNFLSYVADVGRLLGIILVVLFQEFLFLYRTRP
jgi:hypothetical protein